MKATLTRGACLFGAIFVLAACPSEDDGSTGAPATSTAETPPPPPPPAPTTAEIKPEGPQKPTIAARVKSEVDGKEPDSGHSGPILSVDDSKASFTMGTGWTTSKSGSTSTANGKDGKTWFAANSFGDGGTSTPDTAAQAMGLTDCEWGSAESVAVGKDKLPGSAADGVCAKGSAAVRTAYVSLAGEDLNVIAVGAWEDGADAKDVFNGFRSAKKSAGGQGGDPTGLRACCAALSGNAKSAPPQQQGAYLAAAAACNAALNSGQGRAAIATIRGLLLGANMPATCR